MRENRAGFSMVEMLATIGVMVVVLGMGTYGITSSMRTANIKQSMQDLVIIHRKCMEIQREAKARGASQSLTITINGTACTMSVSPTTITCAPGQVIDVAARLGYASINAIPLDGIGCVKSLGGTSSWSYDQQTGFITGGGTVSVTFTPLVKGAASRTLTIYPQGYSSVP